MTQPITLPRTAGAPRNSTFCNAGSARQTTFLSIKIDECVGGCVIREMSLTISWLLSDRYRHKSECRIFFVAVLFVTYKIHRFIIDVLVSTMLISIVLIFPFPKDLLEVNKATILKSLDLINYHASHQNMSKGHQHSCRVSIYWRAISWTTCTRLFIWRRHNADNAINVWNKKTYRKEAGGQRFTVVKNGLVCVLLDRQWHSLS